MLRFSAGDTVIAPGEIDQSLYIVTSGSLEVVVVRRRLFKDERLAVVGTGGVIGEMSFVDGRPRSALVRALTDVQLLRLGYDSFKVLAAKAPAVARAILLDIARVLARLRHADAFIVAR